MNSLAIKIKYGSKMIIFGVIYIVDVGEDLKVVENIEK